MKKVLFVAFALVLAVGVSAFVSKKAAKTEKESGTTTTGLYWYRVTYNDDNPGGTILSSSDFEVQDLKENVDSPCDPGAVKDCLRGFDNPLPSTSFPYDLPGDDKIQKP